MLSRWQGQVLLPSRVGIGVSPKSRGGSIDGLLHSGTGQSRAEPSAGAGTSQPHLVSTGPGQEKGPLAPLSLRLFLQGETVLGMEPAALKRLPTLSWDNPFPTYLSV